MLLTTILLHDSERTILKKKQVREEEWSLRHSTDKDELQKNVVSRMKSVTNASEDVCVSLLESNSYDLKTSIEAVARNWNRSYVTKSDQ